MVKFIAFKRSHYITSEWEYLVWFENIRPPKRNVKRKLVAEEVIESKLQSYLRPRRQKSLRQQEQHMANTWYHCDRNGHIAF